MTELTGINRVILWFAKWHIFTVANLVCAIICLEQTVVSDGQMVLPNLACTALCSWLSYVVWRSNVRLLRAAGAVHALLLTPTSEEREVS